MRKLNVAVLILSAICIASAAAFVAGHHLGYREGARKQFAADVESTHVLHKSCFGDGKRVAPIIKQDIQTDL